MSLRDKTVLLAVSGGIAAYKAPEIVRSLVGEGARVRVLMTAGAQEFVTPLTLQTLTGEPVARDLFDLTQESQIGHIDLADSADVILVAPATANVVGKIANGIADDLLTTVLLATRAPVVIAPAMNVHMFEDSRFRNNLARLEERGLRIVDPDEGMLACGYEGPGRLPDPPVLVEAVHAALTPDQLAGETVLITAGPTREPLDPVRYLSNRSSGKMGYALARAALRRGAHVVLVTGPTHQPEPRGVECVPVETAAEMAAAVRDRVSEAGVVIAAAAVADYTPAEVGSQKEAKVRGDLELRLVETTDIVADCVPREGGRFVAGFAAETHDVEARARAKMARKGLDMIVANDVSAPDAGFDVDTNRVTILDREQVRSHPLQDKDAVADIILDRIVALRAG